MKIENKRCAVVVQDAGRQIRIVDRRRGTVWTLDEQSAVWGKKDRPETDGAGGLSPLIPVEARTGQNTITVAYKAGEDDLEMIYSLCTDYIEIRLVTLSDQGMACLSLPGSFSPQQESKKYLLPIMQGMLWDGRGSDFDRFHRSGSHGGFSMQMAGVLAETGALLMVPETAVDGLWWCHKDKDQFRVSNLQISSLGSIRYQRVMRLYLTDAGLVPVAKTYRQFVQQRGRFISWEEKLKARPELEKLFGSLMCFIGYSQDPDIDYVSEFSKLKAYGFDSILAYPVAFNTYNKNFQMGSLPPIDLKADEIESLKEMGISVSPWTWINEAMDDGTADRASIYKIDHQGQRIFGWQIDDYKWYRTCSTHMAEFEQKAVDGSYRQMTWDHFDVLTCAQIGECYALDHEGHMGRAMSRSEDLQWLRKTLLIGQGSKGQHRFVSSESFNDLFSLEYDIGSVKAWPQYGPWVFWPVPLTSLVYHDSIIHSWWEPHNYNAACFNRAMGPNLYEYGGGRPDLQSALDALMGCPPDVFPFGAQYGWTGRGKETFTYQFRLADPLVQYALVKAKPVAQLHQKIGKLEMVDFEILSEDGWVQRSAFADGTEVYANFASYLRNDISGVDPLPGQSWIVK